MFFKSHFTVFRRHIFRGSNLSQTQFQNMYFGSVLPGYYFVFHVRNLVNSKLKRKGSKALKNICKTEKSFWTLKKTFELKKTIFELWKKLSNSKKQILNFEKKCRTQKTKLWTLKKTFELKKKTLSNLRKKVWIYENIFWNTKIFR